MSIATEPKRQIFPKSNSPESDFILTPLDLARRCVQVLAPWGNVLEPCAGPLDDKQKRGGFHQALREAQDTYDPFDDAATPGIYRLDHCEIRDDPSTSFFDWDNVWGIVPNWILTNPPWSSPLFLQFAEHAFKTAPNVAFLCPAERAYRTSVIERAEETGHALRAIWRAPWPSIWSRKKELGGCGIVKPGPSLALIWWQKGYDGPIQQGKLPEEVL